jgi:hypothetical protein
MTEENQRDQEPKQEPRQDTKTSSKKGAYTIPVQMF